MLYTLLFTVSICSLSNVSTFVQAPNAVMHAFLDLFQSSYAKLSTTVSIDLTTAAVTSTMNTSNGRESAENEKSSLRASELAIVLSCVAVTMLALAVLYVRFRRIGHLGKKTTLSKVNDTVSSEGSPFDIGQLVL